jgi:hypothetical protein
VQSIERIRNVVLTYSIRERLLWCDSDVGVERIYLRYTTLKAIKPTSIGKGTFRNRTGAVIAPPAGAGISLRPRSTTTAAAQSVLWCGRSESNRHSVTRTGF